MLGLIFFGFVLFGCFGQNTPQPNPNNGTVVVNNTNVTPYTNVIEINMTAKQFGFDPGSVTVKKGDRVRIRITSLDIDHGFAISAYGIDRKIAGGTTEVIEFTADKEGEFDFVCSIPCGELHRMMKGKLVVTT